MARHVPTSAERDFFATFMGETRALAKEAVELDPGVAEALDIPAVSPEILEQLEQSAAGAPASSADEPDDEAVEAPAPAPAETVDVDGFDRVDAEPAPDDEPAPEPELPGRTTHGRLLTDKRAHPLQLLDVLGMRYGVAWASWEPATLWWALRKDFGPVGELTRNKIMALRVAATTDLTWIDWDIFEDCGITWNDMIPAIGSFQPMSPMQIAFTVAVLRGVRDDEPFDPEVIAYIGAILEDHGWVYAPEEFFGPVQELLDRKKWTIGFREEVATSWAQIKDIDPTTIEWRDDRPLDIHLLKLAVVKSYLSERDALRQAVPGAPVTATTASPPVP